MGLEVLGSTPSLSITFDSMLFGYIISTRICCTMYKGKNKNSNVIFLILDCAFPNVTGGYFIGDRHYGGVATLICQEDYILTSSRGYYYVPPTNSTTCYGRYWSYPIPSCLRRCSYIGNIL